MSTQRKYTVLAVDDDEVNLMILSKCVQEAGFSVKEFESGEEAWQYLQGNPGAVDIALLDKMMPGMSGTQILRHIKDSPALHHIPVIMQTGDADLKQMRDGLESGVYYYLTKPFHPDILAAIVRSAANECTMRSELLAKQTTGQNRFMTMLHDADFILKTHEDAVALAATISQAAVYPEFVSVGLTELLFNAIEHGNLEIGYQRKNQCLMANRWQEELASRMSNPEYNRKVVHVRLEKMLSGVHLMIADEGKGFDWRNYMYNDQPPGHANEANGRGIAKALIMLDDLRYAGNGNEAHCTIYLAAPSYAGEEGAAKSQALRNLLS